MGRSIMNSQLKLMPQPAAKVTRIEAIEQLKLLRQFKGEPSEFWPLMVSGMATLFKAKAALLLVREKEQPWQQLLSWPESAKLNEDSLIVKSATKMAPAAEKHGFIHNLSPNVMLVAGCMQHQPGETQSILILQLQSTAVENNPDFDTQFHLLSDIPAIYQLERLVDRSRNETAYAIDALDLLTQINETPHFIEGAMTLCNEVASKHHCQRVSFGHIESGYIELKAISHMEKFERKMDIVQSLEKVMEETYDQDAEITLPAAENISTVNREHQYFSQKNATKYLVSLPVRDKDNRIGVITCERNHRAFSDEEIRGLRIVLNQLGEPLTRLKKQDRWFGARWLDSTKEQLGRIVGYEHTWAKLVTVLLSSMLLYGLLGNWHYRVESPFIVRTNDLSYIPAPFDGYIQSTRIDIGDEVSRNQTLLQLDTEELLLQEGEVLADYSRYAREEDKARASNALSDMRIATALKDQSQAKLMQLRYNLNNATIKAPFSGIIVEGELKKMQGAPVKKGDVLFKVAASDELYLEINVPEVDIHEVQLGTNAEVAFVSQPDQKFPVRITRIHPSSTINQDSNNFIIEAEFTENLENWWRPGMSGVAKIDVGDRNIFWILTHRTVDFFRMYFWW